jgi:CDP-4-dehydro-6-deoxyglucose reductase, E1
MFQWPLMVNNISRQDLDEVIEYLRQDDPKLTHGPKVREFERLWSDWLGVKYSVMVNSGASANELTMLALKEIYGPGEVIVPPLTWVSDVASVLHAGLKPVFVDINMRNLSFEIEKLEKAITPNTRAIFITHVLGINGLTKELFELSERFSIPIVEDVCESHGATYQGRKLGSLGLASNFSFYYAHHMTTIEGGMISTDDPTIYDYVRMMRSHGMVREAQFDDTKNTYKQSYPDLNPDFIFAFAAYNMRPTELNGILGISQLKRLDSNVLKRTKNFGIFLDNLDSHIFYTKMEFEGSSNYAFPIILQKNHSHLRSNVEKILSSNGIEFRRGLSGGGNQIRQPYLKNVGLNLELSNFPEVDHLHFNSWYVGNYPDLNSSQIEGLCNLLNSINLV